MTIKITVAPDFRTTVAIAKTEKLDVALGRFEPEVLQRIFDYGLRQMLNDAGASGKTPAEKHAMATKRYEALLEGKLRAERASADPVDREALDIGRDAAKRKGLTGDAAKDYAKRMAEHPEVRKMAQKRVDEAASLPTIEV